MEEIYDLERKAREILGKANVIQQDLDNYNYEKYIAETEEEKRAVLITVMKMRHHKLKENLKKLVKLKQKLDSKKKKKEREEKEKRENYLKTKNGRIELAIKLEEKAFSYLEQAKTKS
jgi:cell fate regulator YaaT (PSP1 superfamily)